MLGSSRIDGTAIRRTCIVVSGLLDIYRYTIFISVGVQFVGESCLCVSGGAWRHEVVGCAEES